MNNLIKVRFEDKYYPKTFSSREYTYFSDLDLQMGNVVECPTINGISIGLVTSISTDMDIPRYEQFLNYKLKEITVKIDKNQFLSKAS